MSAQSCPDFYGNQIKVGDHVKLVDMSIVPWDRKNEYLSGEVLGILPVNSLSPPWYSVTVKVFSLSMIPEEYRNVYRSSSAFLVNFKNTNLAMRPRMSLEEYKTIELLYKIKYLWEKSNYYKKYVVNQRKPNEMPQL